MQICKKIVPLFALLIVITNTLFAQISIPNVSSPTISGPSAPTAPSIGSFNKTSAGTATTNNSTSSSKSSETKQNIDLTAQAITTLSSMFGLDSTTLGSDTSNDIYSLLDTELTGNQKDPVNTVLFEQILTKLEEIESKMKSNTTSAITKNLEYFSITHITTNEKSNLLAKAKNITLSSKDTDGSFLVSGTINNGTAGNETFYINFKPLNTHTYETNFNVHTTNSKSILKEIASHGPYKASKTGNFITMSIFGPEYYLDVVITVDF